MVKEGNKQFNKKFEEVYKKYDGKFGDLVSSYVLLYFENDKNKKKLDKIKGMV
jgi:hypothetical protein